MGDILQTENIKGDNGEFTATVKTDNLPGGGGDGRAIEIKYKADPAKVKCKEIRLIQTVRIEIDGVPVVPISSLKNHADKAKGHSDGDQLLSGEGTGTCIDSEWCQKVPYYNETNEAGSTEGSGKPSTMRDAPGIPDSDFNVPRAGAQKVQQIFETCAYCADDGKCLDCMTWTNTRSLSETGAGTIHIDPLKPKAAPSDSMKRAVRVFDRNHTDDKKERYCPEERAAEKQKAREAGGLKTLRSTGGLGIQMWNIGVDPLALVAATTNIERQEARLQASLTHLEDGLKALRSGGNLAASQEIAGNLSERVEALKEACSGIRDAVARLRQDGLMGAHSVSEVQTVHSAPEASSDDFRVAPVQVKITYLGGQSKPLPSLILCSYQHVLEMERFRLLASPDICYLNDRLRPWILSVDPADLAGFGRAILANPALAAHSRPVDEFWFSLMIVNRAGPGVADFERIADAESGRFLVDAVLDNIFPSNVFALEKCTRWAQRVRP